jgi:hypothetical protein
MKKLSFAILTIAGALAFVAPALADTVSYNVTTIDPAVTVGGTVTFDGSITAPSTNSGSIAILSDSYSCTGCTVDDTDFYFDTPYELAPGDNYTGPLFTVTTFSTDVPGVYDGSFDVQFADALGNTFTDSAPFEVSVTPEPGTWLLLSTGLAGAWLLRRRLLTRTASVQI